MSQIPDQKRVGRAKNEAARIMLQHLQIKNNRTTHFPLQNNLLLYNSSPYFLIRDNSRDVNSFIRNRQVCLWRSINLAPFTHWLALRTQNFPGNSRMHHLIVTFLINLYIALLHFRNVLSSLCAYNSHYTHTVCLRSSDLLTITLSLAVYLIVQKKWKILH